MASKKRKITNKAGSSSATDFDHHRFKTRAHEHRFTNILRKRSLVRERGLDLREGEFPEIQNQIKRRHWEVLCASPPEGSISIAHEFYANAYMGKDEESEFKSFVRGQKIDYSPQAINRFLQIGDFPRHLECDFERRMYREKRLEEVLQDLCKEGTIWELDSKGRPQHLKKANLKPIPRVWCTIVQSKIIPKAHKSEVTVDKAVLIHCIVIGARINVGLLIASTIQEMAQASSGSLGYPSLITRLCREAGVIIDGDLTIPAEPPITAKVINNYIKSSQQGQGGQEQHPAVVQPGSSHPRASPTAEQLVQEIQQLNSQTQQLHLQNERIIRQNTYLIKAHFHWGEMMKKFATHQGFPTDELGSLPVLDEDLMENTNFAEEEEVAAVEQTDD